MAIDISNLNEVQLIALMGKIQARLSELHLEKAARVRDKVIAMITSEGVDYAELMEHTAFARRKKRAAKRGKIAPKYRNPADKSQTWSGRGRQPRWFKAALRKGKSERSLLIK
jgi:DNA-binding protein H-NS